MKTLIFFIVNSVIGWFVYPWLIDSFSRISGATILVGKVNHLGMVKEKIVYTLIFVSAFIFWLKVVDAFKWEMFFKKLLYYSVIFHGAVFISMMINTFIFRFQQGGMYYVEIKDIFSIFTILGVSTFAIGATHKFLNRKPHDR